MYTDRSDLLCFSFLDDEHSGVECISESWDFPQAEGGEYVQHR